MHVVVVAILALLAALWQCGPLALWPVAPDLGAAVAAYLVTRVDNHRLLLRLWVVGLMRDVIDPGATIVYGLLYIVAALGLTAARDHLPSWVVARVSVVAAALALILRLADIWWSGMGGESPVGLLLRALFTAGVACGLLLLLGPGRGMAGAQGQSVRTAVVT